jgi:hypothetical protein
MVPISSLWLPILLSAVLVFIASSIIHMVLPYHRSDYRKVPAEDEVMEALRKFNIPPGDYVVPCPDGPAGMSKPEFLAKREKGPILIMTLLRGGKINMGPQLFQWFLFSVVVSLVAAYIAGRALGPGADYLKVFRFAGVAAFAGYALGYWPNSIWYKRAWSTTIKVTFDGLVYAMLTAGSFGWLWPR